MIKPFLLTAPRSKLKGRHDKLVAQWINNYGKKSKTSSSLSKQKILIMVLVVRATALFSHNNFPSAKSFTIRSSYISYAKRNPSIIGGNALSSWHRVTNSLISHDLRESLPLRLKPKTDGWIHTTKNDRTSGMNLMHSLSDSIIEKQKKQQREQEKFKSRVETWPCLHASSSNEFVTHFVAMATDSNHNFTNEDGNSTQSYELDNSRNDTGVSSLTVEEAILSVLPTEVMPNQVRNLSPTSTSLSPKATKLITKNLLRREEEPVIRALEPQMRHDPKQFPLLTQLCPAELIALGSVWFLPGSAPRGDIASGGQKPVRLQLKDLTRILQENDYLRIHHSPRRFPTINTHDWGGSYVAKRSPSPTIGDENSRFIKHKEEQAYDRSQGAVIAEDMEKGYIIVNKPGGVPVHPTVDNLLENVSAAVGRSLLKRNFDYLKEAIQNKTKISDEVMNRTRSRKQKKIPLIYVAPVQRLDQNTSGIFVVGVNKTFAAYFAKLLRDKTGAQLKKMNDSNHGSNSTSGTHLTKADSNAIYKKYRCLVCITGDEMENPSLLLNDDTEKLKALMFDKVAPLHKLSNGGAIVQHYLKPSDRAPKIFRDHPGDPTWFESLLKITNVGNAVPVIGSESSICLSKALWGHNAKVPKGCVGVVEVELELLTGRTHQIRGQLSQMGFPLCGDAMYGGVNLSTQSLYTTSQRQGYADGFIDSDCLALQCCELRFPDPEYVTVGTKNKIVAIRSDRLNHFKLDEAWWSPHLERYHLVSKENKTG